MKTHQTLDKLNGPGPQTHVNEGEGLKLTTDFARFVGLDEIGGRVKSGWISSPDSRKIQSEHMRWTGKNEPGIWLSMTKELDEVFQEKPNIELEAVPGLLSDTASVLAVRLVKNWLFALQEDIPRPSKL